MTKLLQRRIDFARQIDVEKCEIDKVQNFIMFLLSFENIPELTKFISTEKQTREKKKEIEDDLDF